MGGNAVATGGFVCPNCSNTGASYDSGKLTCLKCGVTHVRETSVEKPVEKQKEQIEF
jgi:transcription initiation factor TFIIIB Brf1 subunit/transcription initiation factor TFIIB